MTHYTDHNNASASHLASAAKSGGAAGAAVGFRPDVFPDMWDWKHRDDPIRRVLDHTPIGVALAIGAFLFSIFDDES